MLFGILKNFISPFRDFLYPPLCFVCTVRLDNGDERVCSTCWSKFTPFNVHDPVWHELHHRFISEGAVKDFLSCFYFEKEGTLQEVIHLLKYRGITSMGVRLGTEIGKRIVNAPAFSCADVLVPVPLHGLKQRERGYNQSEFLCKGISHVTHIPLNTHLVKRARYTHSQTQLAFQERKENVEGAFEIPLRERALLKGKTVILVDDVITTGSTLNACARELLKAGARTILAASAAVAQ